MAMAFNPFHRNPFQPTDPKTIKYPPALGSYIQTREFRYRFGRGLPLKSRLQQIEADIEAVARLRQNPPMTDKDSESKLHELVQACDTLLGALRFELWDVEQALKKQEVAEPGHLGGGTPTHLSAAQLERLLASVRRWLPLAPTSEREFA